LDFGLNFAQEKGAGLDHGNAGKNDFATGIAKQPSEGSGEVAENRLAKCRCSRHPPNQNRCIKALFLTLSVKLLLESSQALPFKAFCFRRNTQSRFLIFTKGTLSPKGIDTY
jgi:hypothetical protein